MPRIAVADHAAATRGDATDRCVMRGRHASKNMGKWRDRRGSRDRQDNELTTMLPRPGVAAQSPTRSGLTIQPTNERPPVAAVPIALALSDHPPQSNECQAIA